MFIPVTKLPNDLAEHLTGFDDVLSKPQQRRLQSYVEGLVICEGKRTIISINATRLPEERKDDTSVSRFVERYKWSADEVEQRRVARARAEIAIG